MKKQTLVSAAAAAAMMPLFGLSGFASADTNQYISIYNANESLNCYIYNSTGTGTTCDASYGSYDTSAKTLKLGSSVNSEGVTVQIAFNDSLINITSDIDIATHLSTVSSSNVTIVFDFGTHSYTENAEEHNTFKDSTIVEIKSGNINLESGSFIKYIINGGNVKFGKEARIGILEINDGVISAVDNGLGVNKSFTMNGGHLTIKKGNGIDVGLQGFTMNGGEIEISDSYFAIDAESIKINDGKITATDIKYGFDASGISTDDGITVKGGEISLKGTGAYGFHTIDDVIKIEGGNISIDGFDTGISTNKNKIYFNGGTTKIKNSKTRAVSIDLSDDAENAIVFGDDMGIKEDVYVFYEGDSTGIVEKDLVTITKGYTYRRHYGWEIGEIGKSESTEDPVPDAGTPKTPDTGAFSASSSAVLIALSVVLVAILSGAGYLGVYSFNRHNRKVKFNK